MRILCLAMVAEDWYKLTVIIVVIIVAVVLLLAEREKAKFSEQEVLDCLNDWRSHLEIKKMIESNKQVTHISGHRLADVLKKLECEKKIAYKTFPLTREEALSYNQKSIPKYKVV